MFISLKWKASLAVTLLLVFLCGLFFYDNSQHSNGHSQQQLGGLHRQHIDLFSGLVQRQQQQLQQLSTWLPESAKQQGVSNLDQIIEQNWLYLQAQWGLEGLSLYDKDGKLQHAWGKSLPLPKDTIKRALSRGQAGPKLSCSQTCSHSALVPVLGSEGPQLLQLDTQLAPLLNDFRRISKAEIGIISAVPSSNSSTGSNYGTNISAWNQRLIHLTQEQNT
ncbi:MAG: hypothetical protein OIF38_14135, partial [Cellvibrionaceae bacterium]|nr:hypothetical protein [Cellvibrionaceae bacterium]